MFEILFSLMLTVGIAEARSEHYERALPLLNMVENVVPVDKMGEYWFYKAVCHHQLMQKTEALLAIRNLEDGFNFKPPVRYLALAYGMTQDMSHWQDKTLEDIERRMNNVGRRLNLAYGGKETQRQQEEIVRRLNELIKEKEDQKNGASAKSGDAKSQSQKGSGSNPDTPAQDSHIMGGSGQGKIDETVLRKYAESWGTMPPAQRAKVIKELTQDLPAKFEPMIKNYFESLDKGKNR